MSKNFVCFITVHCIACVPVNHAYVFMGKIFVEVQLAHENNKKMLPHENYSLYCNQGTAQVAKNGVIPATARGDSEPAAGLAAAIVL